MREVAMFLIASFLIFQIGPVSTGVVSGQELPATPSSSELRLQEILRNIPAEVERYSSLNGGIVSFSKSVIPSQETSASSQSDKERLRENLRALQPYTVIKVILIEKNQIGGRSDKSFKGRLVEVREEGFTIESKARWRKGRWNPQDIPFDQVKSIELETVRARSTAAKVGIGLGVLAGGAIVAGLIVMRMIYCNEQGC